MGQLKVVQVFADGKAWVKQGDRKMDMPPPVAAQLQKNLWRDPNFILSNASQPGTKVRALPGVTDAGVQYDALAIIAPDGDVTKLWLDIKTHLIARLVYSDGGKETRDVLGDYKAEAGVHFPRKWTHSGDGQTIEVTYDNVKVNPALPADLFKP
jgi:hypothetical protein